MNRIFGALLAITLVTPAHAAMTFATGKRLNTTAFVLPGDFTVSVWVKPTALPGTCIILGNTTDSGGAFIGTISSDSIWYVRATYPLLSFNVPAMSNGVWYYLAVVRTSGVVHLYLNGVESTSGGGANAEAFYFDTLMGYSFNSAYDWQGDGDDFRFYSRALSSQELTSLYTSRCRLNNTGGLVGYWRFDDGVDGTTASGASIRDFSGNGLTATAVGSPLWRASTEINYP